MNVVKDDTSDLSEVLATAHESLTEEIIRQAECYLDCQMITAIAADQRATSFAAVMAGAIALLSGGAGAVLSATDESALMFLGFVPCVILFAFAMLRAFAAAEPCDFEYRGNDPKGWVNDIKLGKTRALSLAEQAAHFSVSIAKNSKVMDESMAAMKQAMKFPKYGVWSAGIAAVLAAVAKFSV